MFQNISKDDLENSSEEIKVQKESIGSIAKRLFAKENIILYVISFMVSMVGLSSENVIFSMVPFGLSFIAAALSQGQAIGIMYALSLIGTFIRFGANNFLTYFITTLVFFVLVLMVRPKVQEGVNEKKKIGAHLFLAVLIVQLVPVFFDSILVYDIAVAFMLAITSYIFYKIFVSSILLIKEFGSKKAFTIEEVMGTSLLLAIAFSAFGDFSIWGFCIKNILSILIVLILGWKNGILVGATGGITIGIVVGIIGGATEPVMIAVYAVSGMLAGLLNRFGRIGVVVGFIIGNVVIAYVSNGNTVSLIRIQEVLIAALGLLAVPKNMKINIEDLFGKEKLLPETTGRNLEENQDTIYKLNNISYAIFDMAESYEDAAATILSDEELKKQEKSNIKIFLEELKQNLDGMEDNMLYEDMYYPSDELISDIFDILLEKEIITEKDFVQILASHNNYIIGFEDTNEQAKDDVYQMVKIINRSYKTGKINFIWKKKLDESKKNVSNQLKGVSEAISKVAEEIKQKDEDIFADKKEEIKKLLTQKEIEISDIDIKQAKSGRYEVTVYTDICDDTEGTNCPIKKIGKIVSTVLNAPLTIQKEECGLRLDKQMCKYTYLSADKYNVQVGIAKSTKEDSPVSGDSSLHVKLDDGKYLLAISDGMGSGPEAMKSSKVAIKMLERLLVAGFDKDVSLKLINSTLVANAKEDMYATLDIQILDLFNGNMEFIKNSACPTYVKRNKEVQLLKAITLPAGVLENVDLVVYDYDLQDGDVLVMCSDGVVDSNKDYLNKQMWLKYLLEEINTDDAQKIADIIVSEAIDNDFGVAKDDMTVIATKISKKK